MLTLPPSLRVFLAIEPVDMRGSFDALAGRVRALGLEPSDGHLYLFLSRRGQLAKCLYFGNRPPNPPYVFPVPASHSSRIACGVRRDTGSSRRPATSSRYRLGSIPCKRHVPTSV